LVIGQTLEVFWEFGYFYDFMGSSIEVLGGKPLAAWIVDVKEFIDEIVAGNILCCGVFDGNSLLGGGPAHIDEIQEFVQASAHNTVRFVSWTGDKDAVYYP